jgi:hypothetical protein
VATITLITLLGLSGSVLQNDTKADQKRLRDYNNRLGSVISELLSKTNELDHDRTFAQLADRQLSQTISDTCEQLVTLADSISLIDHLLKDGQLDEGRRDLLVTCHAADTINKRIEGLRTKIKSKSARMNLDGMA